MVQDLVVHLKNLERLEVLSHRLDRWHLLHLQNQLPLQVLLPQLDLQHLSLLENLVNHQVLNLLVDLLVLENLVVLVNLEHPYPLSDQTHLVLLGYLWHLGNLEPLEVLLCLVHL